MAKAARLERLAAAELIVQADVSNEEQVKQMFATTIEEFGRLDILVNNAGIQKPCPSHEIESCRLRSRHLGESARAHSCARARPSGISFRAPAAA